MLVQNMVARTLLTAAVSALAVASAAESGLRPESELTHSCFGFPAENFNRNNAIKATYGASPHTAGELSVGEQAYDFTLTDLDGTKHTLSDKLAEKPVLLLWGMWTCPAYQGLGTEKPFDQCSYKDEWDLTETYKDSVSIIHLVGPEPHPTTPDTNFDTGKQLMNYWSTVRQPKTMANRIEMAKKVKEYTHPNALLLVDSLSSEEGEANQGVWCTMGLGARTSVLIGMDGLVKFKEDWFRADNTANAIEKVLESSS